MYMDYNQEVKDLIETKVSEIVEYFDELTSKSLKFRIRIPLPDLEPYAISEIHLERFGSERIKCYLMVTIVNSMVETNQFKIDLNNIHMEKKTITNGIKEGRRGLYTRGSNSKNALPNWNKHEIIYKQLLSTWATPSERYPKGLRGEVKRVIKLRLDYSHLDNFSV